MSFIVICIRFSIENSYANIGNGLTTHNILPAGIGVGNGFTTHNFLPAGIGWPIVLMHGI